MSVPLTTSPGGLFTRLGKILKGIDELNAYRGSTTFGPRIDAIFGQYLATNSQIVDTLYSNRDSYRLVHASLTTYLQGLAQTTLVKMVRDDVPLTDATLFACVKELIRQMVASSDTVLRPTVSVTVTPNGSNTGTGVCVASILGPDGKQRDYIFAEALRVTCTSDAQVGATEGREPFTADGADQATDSLSWDWPAGSGISTSITATDGSVDTNGNLLTNSGFETFTVTNVPDKWSILVGSAGVDVFKDTTSPYKGTADLKFLGDGVSLTSVAQTFNDSVNGTASTLLPSTVYAVNAFVKVSAVPAAGVLEIALLDQSNTITTDAAGTQNKFTYSLPGAGDTNYHAINGFFRTPAVLPTSLKLRVRLSTALDNTKAVFIDNLAFVPATELYSGGPYVSIFSGATKFITGDYFTVTVANNLGSGWQKGFERLFGMKSLGLQLPSVAAGNTINENLIV